MENYSGKSRNWCFTYFGEMEDLDQIKDSATYLIYQLEKAPETERLHYQGYVEFKECLRMGEVKKRFGLNNIHLEPRRGTQKQAIDYCSKTDSKIKGPWIFGKPKNQGHRSDIDEIYEDIRNEMTLNEILNNHGGNALRIIHAVERAMYVHHGFSSIDNWIKLKRKPNKDKLDEIIMDKLEDKINKFC